MANNALYDEHALNYLVAIEKNAYNAHYERPSLTALLPPLKDLAVLDMGCGPGVYSRMLLQRGAIDLCRRFRSHDRTGP